MSDKPEKAGTLAALQDLKAQYLIGSLPAFEYLKAQRRYEEVLNHAIAEKPHDSMRRKLTLRQVGALIDAAIDTIHFKLEHLAAKNSSLQNWSVDGNHYVFDIIGSVPRDLVKQSRHDQDTFIWQCDLAFLFDALMQCLGETNSGSAIIDSNNVGQALLALPQAVRSVPFLTEYYSQTAVSLEMFAQDPRWRQYSNDGWMGAINAMEQGYSIIPCDPGLLLKASQGDLNAAHELLQQDQLHWLQDCYQDRMNDRHEEWQSGNLWDPADNLLFGAKNLWKRADREFTLGLIEVERRIALNHLRPLRTFRPDETEEYVDAAIADIHQKLVRAEERLRSDKTNSSCGDIYSDFLATCRRLRYIWLALKKNRPWLIEFLSR